MYTYPVESFSDWLEQQRIQKGWTISELARQAGVKPASLSRVLNGTRRPGPDMCNHIAHALKFPPERIFREAGLLSSHIIGDEKKEQELIDYFRLLNHNSKNTILTLARALHEQQATYTTEENNK